MNTPLSVVILVFDDVEILDFCGPYEVFSVVNRDVEPPAVHVTIVAESQMVTARGGLTVERHCSLTNSPTPDVLLIPGGAGINRLLHNSSITDWVIDRASNSKLVTSVCTGAVLLGHCGILDGLEATTHHRCVEQLRNVSPRIQINMQQRFVDCGKVITSAGISAGIDMSLHIVGRMFGVRKAREVAVRMEYNWID